MCYIWKYLRTIHILYITNRNWRFLFQLHSINIQSISFTRHITISFYFCSFFHHIHAFFFIYFLSFPQFDAYLEAIEKNKNRVLLAHIAYFDEEKKNKNTHTHMESVGLRSYKERKQNMVCYNIAFI